MKITRRSFIRGVATITALASVGAAGQRTNPLPRVAFVYAVPIDEMTGSDPTDPRTRAFVHGLRELGLVDGRNIIIERRSNGGSPERYPALMQEVVGLGVDVIVAFGPGAMAAHRATDRIPIVALAADILDAGLVDSLARPGATLPASARTVSTVSACRS